MNSGQRWVRKAWTWEEESAASPEEVEEACTADLRDQRVRPLAEAEHGGEKKHRQRAWAPINAQKLSQEQLMGYVLQMDRCSIL